MGGIVQSSEVDGAASFRQLRMEVAGLQAVLAGRLIQDRAALLPTGPDERRMPTAQERGFFDLKARYGPALDRLERTLSAQRRGASDGLKRLRAIDASLKEIAAAPAMLGVIKSVEALPDTTVVRDDETTVSTGADDPTDTSAPTEAAQPPIDVQPWESYSPEDQEAARGYFEGGTRVRLEQETGQIVEAVHRGRAFRLPNGDLDWNQINDVISGVIFGAALGVGGAAGGALAAAAFLVVPRMLAAIEEGIGDFLIGDIPGF